MQNKSIKKIGVIIRPSTPELKSSFFQLKEIFISHGIDVYLDSISGGMIDVMGMEFDLLCQRLAMIGSIFLGDDGQP